MGIMMNGKLVKWLKEFSKSHEQSAAKEDVGRSNVEDVVKELEQAAGEIAASPRPIPLEPGEIATDFVIPKPIKLELADKYAAVEPVKLDGLTEKSAAVGPVKLEVTDKAVPPEPVKLEDLMVKEVKVDAAPVEAGPEETNGLMGDIFQQDEAEDNSVLRSLIASLAPVSVQELLSDMVEVKVLMRDWNHKDTRGKEALSGNRSPG